MSREVVPPSRDDDGEETHPAWAMIGASRVSTTPGATLFDSDIRHGHTIRVRISTASRRRDLNHDFLHDREQFVEVEMSEAQWASFVSSMNVGGGVPCTIRRREKEAPPGVPHEPRLHASIAEVRDSAERAFAAVREAFDVYAESKKAADLRSLEAAIENAPSNVAFAGDSLTKHAENVVQRARADIEAAVVAKARQLGLDAGDLEGPALLAEAEDE